MRDFSYLDGAGNSHGPFCASCMQKFYENGYFPIDLAICVHTNDTVLTHTLESLIHLNKVEHPFSFEDVEQHSTRPCSNPCCTTRVTNQHYPPAALIDGDRVERVCLGLNAVDSNVLRQKMEHLTYKRTSCPSCSAYFGSQHEFWLHLLNKNHPTHLSSSALVSDVEFNDLEKLLKNIRLESILSTKPPTKKTPEKQEQPRRGAESSSSSVYYPFLHPVESTQDSVLVSEMTDFLLRMRREFKIRPMPTVTLFLVSRGWSQKTCTSCDSHFPSFAHVLEHFMSPKHFAKVFGEDGRVPRDDMRKCANLMEDLLAYKIPSGNPVVKRDHTASGMVGGARSYLPLFGTPIGGPTTRLPDVEMSTHLKHLGQLVHTCDRGKLATEFESVMKQAPKRCSWCSSVFDGNSYNMLAHIFSINHSEALKKHGGCSWQDIEFWRQKLMKCAPNPKTKQPHQAVPAKPVPGPSSLPSQGTAMMATVNPVFLWNPTRLPLLTANKGMTRGNEAYLDENEITVELGRIADAFSRTNVQKFDATFAHKIQQKTCDLCRTRLHSPSHAVSHIISVFHANLIPQMCLVTRQESNAWLSKLRSVSDVGPSTSYARAPSGGPTNHPAAPRNNANHSNNSQPFVSGSPVPLSFARSATDVHDALSEKEYTDFLNVIRTAYEKYNMNRVPFLNKDLQTLKYCRWCDAKLHLPVNALSHLLSKKHLEKMRSLNLNITKRDVEYWMNYLRKAGLKLK